ncbi:DUF2079 domain-containing protein [Kribbella sandramycini]|uniref:DUF2079 domain-containing protein n=1 Tax=Kribbella sandramycini TaxID=60450 RepID=A0A7Y4P0J6_9ACTN|nr:DUF2079 domain-containing protein [Kribbella sandramycini]MBB6571383.1 putative membrane protein [Kribbella sandramycini]NOL43217.1 DUF2079 domain-containing protein [Kribbella sandramycini]
MLLVLAHVVAPVTDHRTGGRPAAILATLFAAAYTWFALVRHWSYRSGGYDLGIFDQAVRSYSEGRLPVSTIRDPNLILLGDHFHPILVVLAPLYRMFPMAETLLVAQALLFALSIFPITRLACTTVGRTIGLVVGASYGLSWGLLNAISFDFHEIAFAVPLLAFALTEFLSGRSGRAVAFAAPLVLVKEDLGLTVAVLGVLIALRPGSRRLGMITAAGGAIASLLSVFVIIPAFSAYGNYRYLGKGGLKAPEAALSGDLLSAGKLHLVLLLLLPTLFLAVRSPLVALLLPTLGWRLGSTYILYWIPTFHYDAVLMPILFCALIHSLVLLRPYLVGRRRRWARPTIGAALATTCLVLFSQAAAADGPGHRSEFTAAADRMVALVPDGATISTTDTIAPHLSSRTDVYLLRVNQPTEWTLAPYDDPQLKPRAADVVIRDGDLVLMHHEADPRHSPTPPRGS